MFDRLLEIGLKGNLQGNIQQVGIKNVFRDSVRNNIKIRVVRNLTLSILFMVPLLSLGQEKYNMLWITAEDLSPRLGCYGDTVAKTPNIDRLAEEGERFTNAFATYGVCAPSRHTLIMGMYPTSTGAMAMRTHRRTSALDLIDDPELLSIPVYEATPPVEAKCFTEYLRAEGYYCTNNYKTDYQFKSPITAWDESSKNAHWRNRPDKEAPFFAVFNSTLTHESKLFERTSNVVTNREKINVPPFYPDTKDVREGLGRQYDNIHALDAWVGELLTQLKEDGLLEKTIVFFFTDHGDGLPRAKRWVYDSGIKVPLIVRWPEKLRAGTINDELVSFVDFAPTMLSLVEVSIPEFMEGQAFLGNAKEKPRTHIFAFRDRMDPAPETIRAVRDQRYKYVRNYRPDLPYLGFIPYRDKAPIMQSIKKVMKEGGLNADQWQFWANKKPLEELYDTQKDPFEIHNLAAEPQYFDKLDELRLVHFGFQQKFGDLGMISEKELIKKLWHPDGVQPFTATPVFNRFDDKITIRSSTQGASITYRFLDEKRWQLYHKPILPKKGIAIEAIAIRLGFKESEKAVFGTKNGNKSQEK